MPVPRLRRENYSRKTIRARLTFPHATILSSRPVAFLPSVQSQSMELSAKDAWSRLLEEARRELPDATVRTWLEPAEAIGLSNGRLILGAPGPFAGGRNGPKP